MARWQPNARARLEKAAMELYDEQGFDATTVAEIAERAGLTERTFFRYFADKREVLFFGSGVIRDGLVAHLEQAPASQPPLDAVVAAFDAVAGEVFDDEVRPFSLQRQAILDANAELQERNLVKLASWGAALADALRHRGVEEATAGLAAETGMAVFRIAFARWVAATDDRSFSQFLRAAADELRRLTAPSGEAG